MRIRWAIGGLALVGLIAGACAPTGGGGGGGVGGNQPPNAVASATPTTGAAPLSVALSSAGSNDPDGTIASYQWDFGDGTTPSASPNPAHVYGLGGYTATLTVTDNLGLTDFAQVTVNVTTPTTTTTTVLPANSVTTVSGSQHTCALRTDGIVRCWGSNFYGQLGDGTNTSRTTPVTVSGITGATAISAGANHTCAIVAAGATRCWGNNSDGQLGNGQRPENSNVPVSPILLPPASAIAAGGAHTCVVRVGGNASCWGDNFSGQLGTGDPSGLPAPTPRSVSGLSGVTSITAGDLHTCALRSTGAVTCWGANINGQLGDGTLGQSLVPRTVTGLSTATSVLAGGGFTCARTAAGGVLCWGENIYGQLGNGAILPPPPVTGDPPPPPINQTTPVAVLNVSGASAIGVGSDHACAVVSGGAVRCWGRNSTGQLGDGTTVTRSTSAAVGSLSGVTSLSGGEGHTCAARPVGLASCFGDNASGQLGNGSTVSSNVPVTVSGI